MWIHILYIGDVLNPKKEEGYLYIIKDRSIENHSIVTLPFDQFLHVFAIGLPNYEFLIP